jgi:hypothetical protein
MKLRLQFGGWLLAVASILGMALPCAAQKRDNNKPPQQQRQPQRQAPRQERRQQRQEGQRSQNGRPGSDRPRNNAPNRLPPSRETESMGMLGWSRPPNARESEQRPGFNPNRPPNAGNQSRNLSPQERQKLQQDERRFRQFPPQQQQEMRERAHVWGKLTPEQQNHIKSDILPKWQQMSPQRQESARNQHLNDPNFTRGMSEEDKAMLRDLSHMHVGAPDPPNE